jgi:polyferredoxin
MYLNLVVVKRSFCRSYCPYGRFQTALMDDGTLNLAFLEETQDRCLRCSSCVRVCPMGIDIRHGFQIECINCGRCIDACRNIMDRRDGRDGLIAYRFGLKRDNRIKIGTKTAVLILMSALICSATVWSVSNRSDTAFSVQRIATSENRQMSDGSQVQAWRAIIGNRGTVEQLYSIVVSPQPPGMQVRLLGPVTAIRIAPNENRQVGFSIQYASAAVKQQISLELRSSGFPVAQAKVQP